MRLVTVSGIDPSGIEDAVDPRTFARGASYAARGAVRHMEWDELDDVATAVVRGSRGAEYDTSVYFVPRRGGLEFVHGECTCPVGLDCKHVVAVALTVAGATSRPGTAAAAPSWEQQLGSLLVATGSGPQGTPARQGTPLAVELSLPVPAGARAPSKLAARLLKPGRTGWVVANLTWDGLGHAYYTRDLDPAHVALLRELHALHASRSGVDVGYYRVHQEKSIDLAALGSRQLWSLLDEAAEVGVQIVHARRKFGAVQPYGRAELSLDVTAGEAEGSLVVAPVLLADGAPASPVLFLGADGHGVVHVRPADRGTDPADWAFRLARLAAPVPPAVQRMALGGRRLPVPAGQQERFRAEFFPKLRRLAPLVSSDGAFVPPAISGPTLVLHAAYGDAHDLALRWEWAYDVGGAPVRVALDGPDDGFRDDAAERALLDGLDVPLTEHLPGGRLRGLDTMRFTTEVLPLLADRADVAVEIAGEPAPYREAGDSLQIAVSAEDRADSRDWFDLGVTVSIEGREVPFAELFTALATDEPHLLLPDGAYFSLRKPELQTLRTLIEEARALQDTPRGPLRISRFQAGLWAELAALGVVERQARAWEQQVAGLLALDGLGATEVPPTVRAQLRPYQQEGFDWLCFLHRHGLGGILADDMGLGKTLQALALVCHARAVDPGCPPFLIVAPTSVVANWAAEAARFAPSLNVVSVTDTLRRRGQGLAEIVAGAHVVVTSYTLFRLDCDAYSAADWSGLLLDEAQFVKNHQAKIYQCARQLPAPFKLAITGTPMENNLMELWSLLSITAPGLFPSPTRFKEHYARPIERQADAELLARLRRRIRPLMKRRTKEQVAADLPAKQEQLLEVELDTKHRRIYQRHLQRERQKVLGLLHDVDRNRFTILRSLTLLRQLSLHPGLVDAEHAAAGSAKIDALLDQLGEVVAGGHRALVFSQFTGFLAQVRQRLDEAGVGYCYLDGRTRRRGEVVARFTGGAAPVFLISLKAGGFGLNLTEADYCFLLDPWWNPATEAQAIDRTHRIGQTRNVMVYRLIARDTIEEKVLALARRKAELFTGVMDDGAVFSGTLSADDVRELLG